MAKEEHHLTIARLSAYMDEQLSPEEQTQTESHLQDCALCQQQLAELRQTVSLLHALPQPPLPRSFVLPTSEPALASLRAARPARPLAPITSLPRRNGWPAYVAGAVRAVSTLAALVGIVFLLSGLFGTVIPVGNNSTTAQGGSTATSGNGSGISKPQTIPHLAGTTNEETTPTPTPTKGQTVTGSNPQGNTPVQQNPFQAFLSLFSVSMIETRAIIGVLLLVLGIAGFIMVRRL